MAILAFCVADKEFMALFPAWVLTVARPIMAAMTYLGISQVGTSQQVTTSTPEK
jgi:hypothetical protein